MNKKKKSTIVTSAIILGILLLIVIIFSLTKNPSSSLVDAQTAQCIGENSHLYVQLGCPACKTQEEMFGKNYQYLNTTDCRITMQPCIDANITATPTWKVGNKTYIGVQSIDNLKNFTGCRLDSGNDTNNSNTSN